MQHSPNVPWRALKAALVLGAAVAALLAFAGAAGAAVIVVTPDGATGSDHLAAAIATANTNSATSNTIVLSPGAYTPQANDVPFTITKNLTITGDHTVQTNGPVPAGAIDVNGSAAQSKGQSDFVVSHGVTVNMEGFQIDSAGASGSNAAVLDNGTLNWYGIESIGDPGYALIVSAGNTATLNESEIASDQANAISNAGGHLTLNNSTIYGSAVDGIDNQPGYTLVLNNSMLLFQTGLECGAGGVTSGGGAGSIDDDASCGVQYSNQTGADTGLFGNPVSPTGNGGPTMSTVFPNNTFTTGKGVNCPTTDERFFPNPVVGGVRQCDIGATTNGNAQQTAAPSCVVTGANPTGTPPTQTVTLADAASGIGPQPTGSVATDNPSNTPATAYPPPAAVPTPGYSVDNLQINNGSVAFTPNTLPAATLALTASKTTVGTITQWSFTGMNWAGVAKNCF